MQFITDWNGRYIQIARSKGGVSAVADPWHNVIQSGLYPWPPAELLQKVYQSRQVRAFSTNELLVVTKELGFYSDLQSLHSEDAITWSVFGPLIYVESKIREEFVRKLLELINVPGHSTGARVWLWRRLPHPETLVPGGPEIDFGIQTEDVFLLGEAKWRSDLGRKQGRGRDKDQVQLRKEFCEKYGQRLLPATRHFVVLGVSKDGGLVSRVDTEIEGVHLSARDITWHSIASIESHPCAQELRSYLAWKIKHSIS
jgi:hypothetical protein